MMRRKLAALLAAILFGTAAVPTTIAYAQGNDPDAAAVTEVTETTEKEDPDGYSKVITWCWNQCR